MGYVCAIRVPSFFANVYTPDAIEEDAVDEGTPPPPVKKQRPSPVPEPGATMPKAQPQPQPKPAAAPKPKVIADPIVRVKNQLQDILDTDDDDVPAAELAHQTWDIVNELDSSNIDLVEAAVVTILSYADGPTIAAMGEILPFVGRLRKWIVAEHNKDKKSSRIFRFLKVSAT